MLTPESPLIIPKLSCEHQNFTKREQWWEIQIPQISVQLSICGICCIPSLIHGAPTFILPGLKGSAAIVLMPNTTAHLKKSNESISHQVESIMALSYWERHLNDIWGSDCNGGLVYMYNASCSGCKSWMCHPMHSYKSWKVWDASKNRAGKSMKQLSYNKLPS